MRRNEWEERNKKEERKEKKGMRRKEGKKGTRRKLMKNKMRQVKYFGHIKASRDLS